MTAGAGTGIRPLGDADPRAVGPYRLTGRLGSGGMGSVFAGVDAFERRVAVKIVHAQFADDREFRTRFSREVAMLRRVRGTCTTPVLDADVDAPQPWFACEYVPGPTLAERVDRQGPMHGDELFALATGLAEALVALHEAGIVHRDLKPQNVVCSPAGPRVLDLGIARSMEDSGLTRTGMMIGSPAWMSPERFRGQNSTPAADVYAWAMMVAYAATGVVPYGSGAPEVVAMRVLGEEPELSGVPDPLRGLVEWCADKEPTRRPPATQLLSGVTTSWRGILGTGVFAADVVSDATQLIHMHWKDPAQGSGWDHSAAQSQSQAHGGRGQFGAPPAPHGFAPAPGPGHPGPSPVGYAPPSEPPGRPLFRDDAPPAPVHAAGAFAQHPVNAAPAPGFPEAPPGPLMHSGYTQDADTVVDGFAPIPAEGPRPGGRRAARAAAGSGDGGEAPGRLVRPLVAAAAVIVVLLAAAGVYAAARGGGDGKDKDPVQPAAESDVRPPGSLTGPAVFDLRGLKLNVPAGWDARPMNDTSVCLVPLDQPVPARKDCLRGGLRVWVGAAHDRKVFDTPEGWTFGAVFPACPWVAPGVGPATHKTSGRGFAKIEDLTYEHAKFTVTCPNGTAFEPQVWWLPKSKISYSIGGLPKNYEPAVKQIIGTADRKNYRTR